MSVLFCSLLAINSHFCTAVLIDISLVPNETTSVCTVITHFSLEASHIKTSCPQ